MVGADKAEKISITLPNDMLSAIKNRVDAGAYGSTSEVIREAIRLWQRREEEHETRMAVIRERLERSANSGTPIPIDEAFDQITAIHQQHINAGNNEKL